MSTEDCIGLLGFAVAGLAVLLLLVYLKLRALVRSLHARVLACECELDRLTNDRVHGFGRN